MSMFAVDRALQARHDNGKPLRVGIIGAGYMARGLVYQIIHSVPSMRVAAISNRTPEKARDAYIMAGIQDVQEAGDVSTMEDCIARNIAVYTGDPFLICQAGNIDIIVEATGDVEYGARVTMEAIRHGKDIALLNAEVDGTVGPILKTYADRAGVIISGVEGDQPGLEMNLYRYVKTIGFEPLVCGNIKGLQDPYRNPETQKGFAAQWGQQPQMVASFADGTKISFEQAIVANATGMTIAKRGMNGFDFTREKDALIERFGLDYTGHVDDLRQVYDVDELRSRGGIVDYVVGLKPPPGIYVIAANEDKVQQQYLGYYKMGKGPLYSFYTPMHICHFDFPISIARIALGRDPVIAPDFGPMVDVISLAKRDLRAGEVIDGLGGFHTYGECETYDRTVTDRLLPIGLAEGCTLVRDVPKDAALTYADVRLPEGRLCDELRREQEQRFPAGHRTGR
ncbi:MAG: NAD(P)H-dependent oxidoreductase [Chitinophagaceae bacterium]|jgi:predicted homoserine dehydrogenase-like protein